MSNDTPWLSILIPVYNVAPYLQECLDSLVTQGIPGVEILALDDCSTDNSLELLRTIAQHSIIPITILTHEHNRGLSAARNTLLDAARGDYLWFLDSDDFLHQGAIAQLYHIIGTQLPDMVLCDYSALHMNPRLKHRLRDESHLRTFDGPSNTLMDNPVRLFEGIYQKRKLHIWSKITRRSLWEGLRFPEGRVMEDIVVTPRLALRVKTYFYTETPWIVYRQRQGSILTTNSLKKIDDMSLASTGVLDLWLKHHPGLDFKARFAFMHFCVRTHIFVRRDLHLLNADVKPDVRIYRERFLSHIHCNKNRVCWEYVKRGWLLRLRRFILEY